MTITRSDTAKPGLRAHEQAVRRPFSDVVSDLRQILGAKLVAYLGGVRETRAVAQWADGSGRTPSDATQQRLRAAFQVAALLREHESAQTVAAWFQGMNPALNDVAPARLLRERDLDEAAPQVLAAARAFVALG